MSRSYLMSSSSTDGSIMASIFDVSSGFAFCRRGFWSLTRCIKRRRRSFERAILTNFFLLAFDCFKSVLLHYGRQMRAESIRLRKKKTNSNQKNDSLLVCHLVSHPHFKSGAPRDDRAPIPHSHSHFISSWDPS